MLAEFLPTANLESISGFFYSPATSTSPAFRSHLRERVGAFKHDARKIMGRTSINKRLGATQRLDGLTIFGMTICVMAVSVLSAGCSKIGTKGALNHGRLPFNNRTGAAQSAQQSPQQIRDRLANRVPDNPVREETRDLQTGKARPPKLSAMPTMTLYAEPVVTAASQVSWEQDATSAKSDSALSTQPSFDPTAEPPAQIFAQPVQTPILGQDAAPRIADSRTLAPMLFDNNTRQVNSAFSGNLRDGSIENIEAPPAPRISNPVVDSQMSQSPSTEPTTPMAPLIVLDENSDSDPLPVVESEKESAITIDFSASESTANDPPSTTPNLNQSGFTNKASKIANVDPFPLVPEIQPAQIQPAQTQPAQTQPAQTAPTNDPIVSSEAFVAHSHHGSPSSTTSEAVVPIVDSALDARPATLEPQSSAGVIVSDINLAAAREIAEIKIDANLVQEFDAFPPLPEPLEQPEIEVEDIIVEAVVKNIEPLVLPSMIQAMPVLDPPTEDALVETLSEEKSNQVAESDFEPLPEQAKRCPNCSHDNCSGCALPGTALFAGHIPNFDPGRSAVPMPVAVASLPSVELVKKNFADVNFSPTDLPLPQDKNVHDVHASFDTSEDQFSTVGFETEAEDSQVIQTDVPPVGVEALMKLNAVTWQSRLAQTVNLVQEQLNQQNIDSDTRTSLEVNLRLLDVLSRQMGDLVENQQQFSSSENQYWQDQLEAITSMLKVADPVDSRANELLRHHTAHETLTHLRNAVAHLESLANLRVVAGEFCTEVSGYGQFNPFVHNVFPVGQKVLVYCEIENFNSTPQTSEDGDTFLTRLRGSYAIYDSSGHAVQQAEFPTLEDVARKRRRDFYMHLPITIGNLAAGNYELHLLIEDLGGNKTASLTPPLLFTVEDQQEQPVTRQAQR